MFKELFRVLFGKLFENVCRPLLVFGSVARSILIPVREITPPVSRREELLSRLLILFQHRDGSAEAGCLDRSHQSAGTAADNYHIFCHYNVTMPASTSF